MDFDLTKDFKEAFDQLEKSFDPVFVTGKAGTGKSTLLEYFRDHTQKKVVVLAPTGVAAVNVGGQTIHSFFKFKAGVSLDSVERLKGGKKKKTIYQKLDAIIIDEISMVRADLMDCIDKFMRLNGRDKDRPFGGCQLIFFGDLYQLPPVVRGEEQKIFEMHYKSPYFFDARVFDDLTIDAIELKTVYRQKDDSFIKILNGIRQNRLSQKNLDILNQRVDPDFKIPKNEIYIHLCPTNRLTEEINLNRLKEISGKSHFFSGEMTGTFKTNEAPTALDLELKIGAQIMMVNNDPKKRWVNGTMGKILDICPDYDSEELAIKVLLETGKKVKILPHNWEIQKFVLEEEVVSSKTVGSFTQYPIMLAWAITIHKSQGKTFEKCVVDLGSNVFSTGQTYVALSRCVSLDGMVLSRPVHRKHIWIDERILVFLSTLLGVSAEEKRDEEKIVYIRDVISKKGSLEIDYEKADGERTVRVVEPTYIGKMAYQGNEYLGMRATCNESKQERAFRVDRIFSYK